MTREVSEVFENVSRETMEKMVRYCNLVRKWSSRINLISKNSVGNVWGRHVADSMFLAKLLPGNSSWVDIGSGGGFPGVVVAILYEGIRSVTLVESDKRKVAFLKTVRRDLELDFEIKCQRVESIVDQGFDVISARALAPLPKLLDLCVPVARGSTTLLLPKGLSWGNEVDTSSRTWSYKLEVIHNPYVDGAVVLKISNLTRI